MTRKEKENQIRIKNKVRRKSEVMKKIKREE